MSKTQTCDELLDEKLRRKFFKRRNLSLDQVIKEDNRSNKQYLFKQKESCTLVQNDIYLYKTLKIYHELTS